MSEGPLDREQLRSWLQAKSRTFRYNDGTHAEFFDAVDVSAEGLRWYRRSHQVGDDELIDVKTQTVAAFLADGPAREAPARVVQQVRAFLETLVTP